MQSTSIAPWQQVCNYTVPNTKYQSPSLPFHFHLHHSSLFCSYQQPIYYQNTHNTTTDLYSLYSSCTKDQEIKNTNNPTSYTHQNQIFFEKNCTKDQAIKNTSNPSSYPLQNQVLLEKSCTKDQEFKNTRNLTLHPHQNQVFLEQTSFSDQIKKTQFQETQKLVVREGLKSRELIVRNMWWDKIVAAIGQRLNLEGITCSIGVFTKDKHLLVPHVAVPDIRYIDWGELKRRGFQGVVFDKDNTLTVPYSLALWGPLRASIEDCKSVFGDNVAIFSNSAGLHEYDSDGRKARAIEFKIGIKVVRHKLKKPAGSAEEVERHFGCESTRLIMVGDRPFTDIVYGNRNGYLTILTNPLSLAEEPFVVRQVRKLEAALVKRWSEKGIQPINHRLLPDSQDCVKVPS